MKSYVGTEFKGALGIAVTEDGENYADVLFAHNKEYQQRCVAALNATSHLDVAAIQALDLLTPGDRCVVLSGNLADGHRAIGPFATYEDAVDYCEKELGGMDWFVFYLENKT